MRNRYGVRQVASKKFCSDSAMHGQIIKGIFDVEGARPPPTGAGRRNFVTILSPNPAENRPLQTELGKIRHRISIYIQKKSPAQRGWAGRGIGAAGIEPAPLSSIHAGFRPVQGLCNHPATMHAQIKKPGRLSACPVTVNQQPVLLILISCVLASGRSVRRLARQVQPLDGRTPFR
jgi:hypothetical protein